MLNGVPLSQAAGNLSSPLATAIPPPTAVNATKASTAKSATRPRPLCMCASPRLLQSKRGVQRRRLHDLLAGRVRRGDRGDACHQGPPPSEVGPQHGHLLRIGELHGPEVGDLAAQPEPPAALGPE